MLHEVIETMPLADRHSIHHDDSPVFKSIWPFAAHAIEQVKAALILIDSGYAYLAEVNGRSALEHAIVVQWIMWTDQSEYALVSEMLRINAITLEEMEKAHAISLSERDQTPKPPRTTISHVQNMANRFSPDGFLYLLYRRLSDAVHPSLHTIQSYLQFDEYDVSAVVHHIAYKPSIDFMHALMLSLMSCLTAVAGLDTDNTRLTSLMLYAENHEVPFDLVAGDRTPHLTRPAWPREDST